MMYPNTSVLCALLLPIVSACSPFAGDLERERIDRDSHAFPIVSGAHGGIACNECHGDFDTFSKFDCLDCHIEADVGPAHSGISGYAYENAKCYECHPTGERMTREQHDPIFPLTSGNHKKVDCAACHVSGFSSFSCTDCHEHSCSRMDSKHQGEVSGYSCSSPRCYDCHPKGKE